MSRLRKEKTERTNLARRSCGRCAIRGLKRSSCGAALLFASLIAISLSTSAFGLPRALASQRGDQESLPASHSLIVGDASAFHLPTHGQTAYLFRLMRSQYAEVSIEQLDGLLQAVLLESDGRRHTPVTLDAGRTSIIRLPLIAPQDGIYSVEISCRVPLRGSCSAVISISQPRRPSAADRDRSRAESLLALAEQARRKGARNSWPEALRDYDHAAEITKSLGDPELLRAALTGKARILLYDLNNYKDAGETAELAVEAPSHRGDGAGQALAWKTLGAARYYLGDYPGSIEAAKRALALYRSKTGRAWF